MSNESEGRAAAEEFRRRHGLGVQPLGDLVTLIEQATGHDVAVLHGTPDEHGLTVRDPDSGATFIGVARTRHPMRQRSTLAHELAHVIFSDWGKDFDPTVRSPAEIRADSFARHLLLPASGLTDFLGEHRPITEAEFSSVVQRFLVSPHLASIALADVSYIDEHTKDEWKKTTTPRLAARYGWIDLYQSLQSDSDRPRPPQRLLARAIAGYEEGVVNAQVIATLRGISEQQVVDELSREGIIPRQFATPVLPAAALPPITVDLSALDDSDYEGHDG